MKLTKRQREALIFLRDDDEYGDLVYEKGSGWRLGVEQTNGKLALGLIRLCLISEQEFSDDYRCWRINESGLRALEGKAPYRLSSGKYVDVLSVYN